MDLLFGGVSWTVWMLHLLSVKMHPVMTVVQLKVMRSICFCEIWRAVGQCLLPIVYFLDCGLQNRFDHFGLFFSPIISVDSGWETSYCWDPNLLIITHTRAHPFNDPFSRTTWVGQYQQGKTNLDFTEARDSEWQWHQLGHMRLHLAPDR